MSGKGSNRRPQEVDEQTMASNWERVFGRKRAGAEHMIVPMCTIGAIEEVTGLKYPREAMKEND